MATFGHCAMLPAPEQLSWPEDTPVITTAIRQLEACQGSGRQAVLKQLRAAQPVAETMLQFWRQPDEQATEQLQVAQAAAVAPTCGAPTWAAAAAGRLLASWWAPSAAGERRAVGVVAAAQR